MKKLSRNYYLFLNKEHYLFRKNTIGTKLLINMYMNPDIIMIFEYTLSNMKTQ